MPWSGAASGADLRTLRAGASAAVANQPVTEGAEHRRGPDLVESGPTHPSKSDGGAASGCVRAVAGAQFLAVAGVPEVLVEVELGGVLDLFLRAVNQRYQRPLSDLGRARQDDLPAGPLREGEIPQIDHDAICALAPEHCSDFVASPSPETACPAWPISRPCDLAMAGSEASGAGAGILGGEGDDRIRALGDGLVAVEVGRCTLTPTHTTGDAGG